MLIGHVDSADVFKDSKAPLPSGYIYRIHDDGTWELLSCTYKKPTRMLAQGKATLSLKKWHHIKLDFKGQQITAYFDAKVLTSVKDNDHPRGMFGIGTGWNRAQFDNLIVSKQ
jgi:hypothetical protein